MKEARIARQRHAESNVCGDCGVEIDDTATLCEICEVLVTARWEPISVEESI
jgi:hypothetical protein